MNSWFYLKEDKQGGPLSDLGLWDLFTRGELSPTALVWREGMPQWVPASSIEGLVPALPPLAAAVPARQVRSPVGAVPPVDYRPVTAARQSGMPAWAWVLIAVGGAACAMFVVLIILLFTARSVHVQTAQVQPAVPPPAPTVQPQPQQVQAQPDVKAPAASTILTDADVLRTEMVGGNGGDPAGAMSRTGSTVLGFRYSLADWGGVIVHKIQPLWSQSDADHAPPVQTGQSPRGYPIGPDQILMARDGYAVGGIVTYHDQYFRGFQVIFMRFDGTTLHPEDQYTTAWCGAPARSETVQLAGNGQRVIGIFGRQGLNRDAFGLMLAR